MLTPEPEVVLQQFEATMEMFEGRYQSEVVEQGEDPNSWIQHQLDYAKRVYPERPDEGTERRLGALVAIGEEKGLLPENYHRTLPF